MNPERPSSDHEMLCEIWETTRKMTIALDEVLYRTALRSRSYRTKAKLRENLGLLIDFLRKKYGSVDEETETTIFSALSWTAEDVENQMTGTEAPDQKVRAEVLGKTLGTIHNRFNEREPHTGAWDEQRIVVIEVIQASLASGAEEKK